MSRRLNIASLLNCDDPVEDHVPLAPHLRNPASSSSSSPASSTQPAGRSRANTYDEKRPSSSHQQPQPFLGLDALVHAATQERRRLSGSDLAQPQPQRPHPPPQQQQQQQQQFSPHQAQLQRQSPQFHRSSWQQEEASYRQPQSPLHPRSIDELSIHSPREPYKYPTSPYAQPRQHSYEDEQRLQQMRQLQMERERDRERHHRAQEHERQQQQRMQLQMQQEDRMRAQEAERLAALERNASLERQRMEEERLRLEAERRRLMEVERRIQEKEQEEQRREAERARLEDDRREREIAAIREAERREQQRRDRDAEQLRRQEEQRYYSATAAEQQRQEDAQRRLQMQQQRQQQQQYMQHAPSHHLNQRLYDHPPRIEIPPGPQTMSSRKSDPMPGITASQSQSTVMPSIRHIPDQRPSKKRRYSESPSLPPMRTDDNLDRIQREREKMTVGEIGYGRFDSPTAAHSAPSYTSPSSLPTQPSVVRRPGSGHGARKPVSVSDLLTPDHEAPSSNISSPSIPGHSPRMVVIPSREPNPPSHLSGAPSSFPPHHSSVHHRIVSPLGRRSPPGSQTGRAKALRKTEEHVQPVASTSSTPPTTTPTVPHPIIAAIDTHQAPSAAHVSLSMMSPLATREDQHHRQAPASKRSKIEKEDVLPSPMLQDIPAQTSKKSAVKVKESRDSMPPPSRKSVPLAERSRPPTVEKEEGDAHDWLLEHYAQASPALKAERETPAQVPSSALASRHNQSGSRSPPSSIPPVTRRTKSPANVPKRPPTPVIAQEQDDDGGLDEELEQLLAEVKAPTPKEEADAMDVDVDIAVAELVAETLIDPSEPQSPETWRRQKREDEEENGGDTTMRSVNSAVDDVEDELLSLVEDAGPVASAPKDKPLSGKGSKQATAARKQSSGAKATPPSRPLPSGSTATPPLTSAPTSSSSPSAAIPRPTPIPASISEGPDRDSMPPPNLATTKDMTAKKKAKGKGAEKDAEGDTVPAKKKTTKKAKAASEAAASADGAGGSTSTLAPKPKAKPKAKKAAQEGEASASTADVKPAPPPTKSALNAFQKGASVSRSRSTSVMPTVNDELASPADAKEQNEEEELEAAAEDDKLYCVCKTKYDQERFMIACDRCDEWYHMQCVDMPELVADLVDQFFRPPCIEKNRELNLTTTYKPRCLWGLKHPDPDSTSACHKPARGAFSKYCSEECGVKYMQSRIDTWAKKGGKKEKLWESVKHAEKREGVVVKIEPALLCLDVSMDEDAKPLKASTFSHLKPSVPTKHKTERDKDRLLESLDKLATMQNDIRKAIQIIQWRERLLSLAVDRAESTSQCGWDQRLCFGDEDWEEELGKSILKSYEAGDDADRMEVDNEEWWCNGESVCSRHVGWQSTRYKDVAKEREKREEALTKLEGREQEIRQRLEELANPSKPSPTQRRSSNAKAPNNTNGVGSKATSKQLHTTKPNGHSKAKANAGEAPKKGKKRKAP